MSPPRPSAAAIAVGAVSAFGTGAEAYAVGPLGERARVALARDPELETKGLKRPFAARAPIREALGTDRATALLLHALGDATAELDRVGSSWRFGRVGLALGTSSGGMLTAERFFFSREEGASLADLAIGSTYFAPFEAARSRLALGGRLVRATQVLAACSASTIAIGLGLRWLDRGACDLVLAGGYDGVSGFVAAGFEVLRATTATTPRPFRADRDGMSLGEGAAVVALVRGDDPRAGQASFHLLGFGASTDAVHITAPDRSGRGIARAGRAALDDAGLEASRVGLVSAHATATPFNDAMESKAIASLFEGGSPPVVHPFKAQIGHTLGAAGVLEMLAAADAVVRGIAPAAAGSGALDPEAPAELLEVAEARPLEAALKLSAAFGGSNGALVVARDAHPRPPRSPRPVHVVASAHVVDADLGALAEATGTARDRLARLDGLCRLGLAAVAKLAAAVGRERLEGAGIVAGHALATIDTNAAFDARLRAKGAPFADPRLFPATSPNALAGECAIVYRLTGPGFSVGSGLDGATEALLAAAELIAAGDIERMVVVAADEAGPASRDLLAAAYAGRTLERGAVALFLASAADGERIDLDEPIDHDSQRTGHLRLLDRFAPRR